MDIDLKSQTPEIVAHWLMAYLSQEEVASGRAFADAEELLQSQLRADIKRTPSGSQ